MFVFDILIKCFPSKFILQISTHIDSRFKCDNTKFVVEFNTRNYSALFPIRSNKDELHFIAIGFILIKIKSFQVLMIKIINKHLNKNIQKENQN